MTSVDSLLQRIDSLLGEEQRRIEEFQQQQANEFRARQMRLERFEQVMRRLSLVLTSRLRALKQRFQGIVTIEPVRRGHTRELRFHFRSELAKICLRLAVLPDREVRQIIFEYDVDIVPVLMKFAGHRELLQTLDQIDAEAIVKWLDDRIVEFVTTYLAACNNSYYLRGQQVEDPVAGVSFPRRLAAATVDHQGQTLFFTCQDTCDEFVKRHPELAGAPGALRRILAPFENGSPQS